MNVDLTASHDACQPAYHCQNSKNIHRHGSPCDGFTSRSAWLLYNIRRWTLAGIAGFCVTVATTSGAIAPAGASQPTIIANPLAHFAAVAPAAIDLTDFATPKIEAPPPAAVPDEISSSDARSQDLLETVEIPKAAEIVDPRSAIIAGMATSPSSQTALEDEISPSYVYFGDRRVSRWIVDAITRAAEATGADPVYMMALADKESSFIPFNKAATSSAEGLFQFISSTWLEVIRSFGAKHGYRAEAEAIKMIDGQLAVADERMREHILGLRRNAYVSALMAGELKNRDTATIETKLGRKISRSEYYLSHFFGVDRARKFMNLVEDKPKQRASRLFPAAAKANKALFFAKAGRKTRHLSVAEVYEKIDAMIDTRLDRYEGVVGLAVADAVL